MIEPLQPAFPKTPSWRITPIEKTKTKPDQKKKQDPPNQKIFSDPGIYNSKGKLSKTFLKQQTTPIQK